MKGPSLGSRDRRALLLGAALVLPVLAYTLAIRPYVDALGGAREQVAAQRELLAREQGLLTLGPIDSAAALARTALDLRRPRLFEAEDVLAAAAAVEGYVMDRARGRRVLVQRSRSGDGGLAVDGVRALEVEVEAVGDLQGLLGFLRALDSGPKLVRVERLVIRPAAAPAGSGGAEGSVLSLTATVRGFALDADSAAAPDAGGES